MSLQWSTLHLPTVLCGVVCILIFFGVYSLLISRMHEVVSFSIQVCIVRVGFAVQYVSSLPLCVCAGFCLYYVLFSAASCLLCLIIV